MSERRQRAAAARALAGCAANCATSRRSPRCSFLVVFFWARQPVLRDARQSGNILTQISVTGDHRRRADFRDPVCRDRSLGRQHRQRHRYRGGVFHRAGCQRHHRQRSAAGLGGDRDRAGGLLRAGRGERVRTDPDRHSQLHHDPGDVADRAQASARCWYAGRSPIRCRR